MKEVYGSHRGTTSPVLTVTSMYSCMYFCQQVGGLRSAKTCRSSTDTIKCIRYINEKKNSYSSRFEHNIIIIIVLLLNGAGLSLVNM